MAQCTVIKLKTVDQRLTAVQQPVLASGDVGTVRVEYALDSYWDGYTASGTFYTGKKPEDVYEQQLTEGACVIPWEVLQEDGVLYIGLRGVDGAGLIKTAAPVRYRIEKGSPVGSATAKGPTPDVYQQMLESMKETEEIAQSVRDDADNGEFIGERGPAGPAGVYVGTEAPTNGETVWIDTDAESDAQIDVVAKVGQVLVVKAVDADGHPTELQAVDFPKAPAANWNANEGEEGHIECRTHYVDEKGVIHKLDNKYIDADWMATSRENIDNSIIIPEQKLTGTTTMWDKRQMDIQPGITYDVHINDVVYPCVAFNEDGICLGNNTSLTKNNLPFCIYWAGGSATGGLFFTNGTLGSSVYLKVTGHSWTEYNTMPEGFLPKCAVKSVNGKAPDANGNVEVEGDNSGGADIDVVASVGQTIVVEEVDADGKPTKWKAAEFQERTHWTETVEAEVIPETNLSYDASGSCFVYPTVISVYGGETYRIVWNGVEYECVCQEVLGDGVTGFVLGNFGAMTGGDDTGEPFVILVPPDEEGAAVNVYSLDGSESVTISIIGKTDIVHQIDRKYIVDNLNASEDRMKAYTNGKVACRWISARVALSTSDSSAVSEDVQWGQLSTEERYLFFVEIDEMLYDFPLSFYRISASGGIYYQADVIFTVPGYENHTYKLYIRIRDTFMTAHYKLSKIDSQL